MKTNMNNTGKTLLLLVLFLGAFTKLSSQTIFIKGKVVDESSKPIEFATVILQSNDNTFQDVRLTDTLGIFDFDRKNDHDYILIIQHLSYDSDTLHISKDKEWNETFTLAEKSNKLGEVKIITDQPIVKMKNNTFVYNAQLIQQRKVIMNAYEMVKEIPGITESINGLSFGEESFKIIINGEISSLSMEQIQSMLKSIPASNIQNIEVMYNAPAKYNTNGVLVNVELIKKSHTVTPISGELGASYLQSYYPSSNQDISLSYQKNKLRVDLLTSSGFGKSWGKSIAFTRHTIKEEVNEISEANKYNSKFFNINSRLGINYAFDSISNFTLAYYFQHNYNCDNSNAETRYITQDDLSLNSSNSNKDNNTLHNIYAQYNRKEFSIGMDYTRYNNPNNQYYFDEKGNTPQSDLHKKSKQDINKYSVFVNHSFTIFKNIKLNYGANIELNKSDTEIKYLTQANVGENSKEDGSNTFGKQTEYNGNAYFETDYTINSKLFASFSAKLEYFKSDYSNNGIRTPLWNDWAFFPNASISYTPNNRHNFQCTFSSNKRYPTFWATTPQVTNLSPYSQIVGNPELSPSRSYTGRLIYSLKRKYMLIGIVQYTPDYFIQIPHMAEDQLMTIYRYENFDYRFRVGLMAVVPFKVGKILSSRLSLQGFRIHEKLSPFYNSSFNNIYFTGMVGLSNVVKFTSDWLFQLDANYNSPNRQGVYRLGTSYDLSARIKWTLNKNTSLVLGYNNILCHQLPRPMEVEYGNQYRWSRDYEKSSVSLSLIWRFGKYTDKQYKIVDQGRLSK